MKKILIGVAVILAVGGYFWWSMSSSSAPVTSGTSAPSESTNPNTGSGTPTSNPPPTPSPVSSRYKDGTYTGNVATSIYGPVQVALVITGGKIVTVNVPVFPNSPGHTTEVSAMAIPILKQEVIASQKGNVDIVSGATQTAEAFNESLSVVLSKAS